MTWPLTAQFQEKYDNRKKLSKQIRKDCNFYGINFQELEMDKSLTNSQ